MNIDGLFDHRAGEEPVRPNKIGLTGISSHPKTSN